jgi:hypothetical protein
MNPVEDVKAWIPLVDFAWPGADFEVCPDTRILRASQYHGFEHFQDVISREEMDRCRELGHWLSVERSASDTLSVAEKVNAFLIALWIVHPTRTHVPFRFEEARSGTRVFARFLDRFQWIRGQAAWEVQDHHLRRTAVFVPLLRHVYEDRRRLRNALVLTLRACQARDWQVGFICFAAAAESILTYSRERGLTARLAKSFARLTSPSEAGRKRAEDQFRRCYQVRSDIVHGRATERKESTINLRDLARFANIVRRLWRVVLGRSGYRLALEGDDRQRERFFGTV